jgi:RNA polymerase sigma-70 factor (ECF subfamily)
LINGEAGEHSLHSAQTRALPGQFTLGSKDELGRLLEEFRPYLLTIATAGFADSVHGKLGVSDVVQETILSGLEDFDQFQGTTREEFAQWLKKILLHRLANVHKAFRTLKRDVTREVLADSQLSHPNQQTASDVAQTRERKLQVEAAIARLSEADREIITLRHCENLTFAEIGNRTYKSEEAARGAWLRAIQRLKQELRQDDSQIP